MPPDKGELPPCATTLRVAAQPPSGATPRRLGLWPRNRLAASRPKRPSAAKPRPAPSRAVAGVRCEAKPSGAGDGSPLRGRHVVCRPPVARSAPSRPSLELPSAEKRRRHPQRGKAAPGAESRRGRGALRGEAEWRRGGSPPPWAARVVPPSRRAKRAEKEGPAIWGRPNKSELCRYPITSGCQRHRSPVPGWDAPPATSNSTTLPATRGRRSSRGPTRRSAARVRGARPSAGPYLSALVCRRRCQAVRIAKLASSVCGTR